MPGREMASVRFPLLSYFSDSGLTFPTSASRNIYAGAQRLRNPGGEFPVAPREFIAFDTVFGFGSFPYPVPPGTRVPKWALLDVTVR
jgi:hypothetical protein